MSLLLLIVTLVIAILFWKTIVLRLFELIKFCMAVNKLPGPARYPLPRLALQMSTIKSEDQYQWFCDLLRKNEKGIMMTTSGFNEVLVHIHKPHHLEVILSSTKNITKSLFYDHLNPWLGEGLLTSTVQDWSGQRKMITPIFHPEVVDLFSKVMSEKVEILNQIIEETTKGNPEEPIEFFDLISKCALDIIFETAIGVNVDIQRNPNHEYISALNKFFEISLQRIHYPWLKWGWIFYKTRLGLEYKSAIDTMTNFTSQVIKDKQSSRQWTSDCFPKNEEKLCGTGERKKKAFLDLLLDLNQDEIIPLTDTELREQVDTFMFTGLGSTAAAINWAIFNLGNNPEIQEKVHQELNKVFGSSEKSATMEEMAALEYLDRVIKENFRLNPCVPGIGRLLSEDVELSGYIIPKGCNVSMSIFNLHRDPEVWPDPLKFDPDRFLPENCRGRHPYAFVPFSAGPRNCIGQELGTMGQKIILTALLRKWKVKSTRTQAEMKIRSNFILITHNGNPMYFTPKQ